MVPHNGGHFFDNPSQDCGLIFSQDHPDDFADKMEKMINNKADRIRWGNNAAAEAKAFDYRLKIVNIPKFKSLILDGIGFTAKL